MAASTIGYMAPEVPSTGKATKESDVYSFGILVLEVVCGRRALDLKASEPEDILLLYRVWRAHEAGEILSVADPRLQISSVSLEPVDKCLPDGDEVENVGVEGVVMVMVKSLLQLGLLCCLPNPKARPTMAQVIRILQQIGDIDNAEYALSNVISMPPLPESKPLGLYRSMEFSQNIENAIFYGKCLPSEFLSSLGSKATVDEIKETLS